MRRYSLKIIPGKNGMSIIVPKMAKLFGITDDEVKETFFAHLGCRRIGLLDMPKDLSPVMLKLMASGLRAGAASTVEFRMISTADSGMSRNGAPNEDEVDELSAGRWKVYRIDKLKPERVGTIDIIEIDNGPDEDYSYVYRLVHDGESEVLAGKEINHFSVSTKNPYSSSYHYGFVKEGTPDYLSLGPHG